MEAIGDYAVIGDCRSAALVSKAGSIDWLCWPRFDSPSIFDALINEGGGCWAIRPVGPFRVERRYFEGTNLLATTFKHGDSRFCLIDFMPVASETDKHRILCADHEILRIAECQQGEIEVEFFFDARPDYGRKRVDIGVSKLAFRLETSLGLLALRTQFPVERRGRFLHGRARLRAGQSLCSSLSFADDAPAVYAPLGDCTWNSFRRSMQWWQAWTSHVSYDGPFRAAVERSALLLKLLVYAPSGAIAAAPTTSLPERFGGRFNWDYRFCWLRDASLTVRALVGLGFKDEAEAFTYWMIHTTALTRPRLKVLYDFFGKSPEPERVLSHFSGYRNSSPVRVGNAAVDQFQLDVYGEVIQAAFELARSGAAFDRETRSLVCAFGEYIRGHWSEPDEGIWEPRSGRSSHTHSKLLCWAGIDRLIEMHGKGHVCASDVEPLLELRETLRRELHERAWNPKLRSYTATLGGDDLDASLLLMAWYGFERPDAQRMRWTYERIRERLRAGDVLLYRHRLDETAGEGAFGVCGFWAAEYLALGGGSASEAEEYLHKLLRYANDVGLFSEEIDPKTGEALGNFPQGFTHIGVINAALSLAKRVKGEKPLERRIARAR